MTRFMNIILASAALATALAPIAANATTMTPLNQVQIAVHKAVTGPLPEVQHVAANYEAAAAQGLIGQTIVQSGPTNQMYPDPLGG
jgi:hypothetical protein